MQISQSTVAGLGWAGLGWAGWAGLADKTCHKLLLICLVQDYVIMSTPGGGLLGTPPRVTRAGNEGPRGFTIQN